MKNTKLILIAFALMSLLSAHKAHAITISPVRFELQADPGGAVGGQIILNNEQNETKTLYSSTANFEAQGETGTPAFVDAKNDLGKWITLNESVTLAPNESKVVPFSISVPKDAEAGGHFAAIFWSDQPTVPGQVTIGAKIGTLVLLSVSGDIKESGGVSDFQAKNGQTRFSSLPVTFNYRFQNGGNDRVKPTGVISVKNMLGFVSANISANPVEGNVLPRSIRKFESEWQGHGSHALSSNDLSKISDENFFAKATREYHNFALGRYTAHLDISYGTKGDHSTATYVFYVFPWHFLIVFGVSILLVLFFFTWGIKSYNKMLIRKFQQSSHSTEEPKI